MLKQKGFSMVELMIVIVIVAILSSVAVPMMRGRIEKAKYTEGMAGCSAIATAVRAYIAENVDQTPAADPTLTTLGFKSNDLDGRYFLTTGYAVTSVSHNNSTGAVTYTVTATPVANKGLTSGALTLNEKGVFKIGGNEIK